jgi:hypothetical protein
MPSRGNIHAGETIGKQSGTRCDCAIVEEPEARDSPDKKLIHRITLGHLTDSQSIVIVAMLLNLNRSLAVY